MDCLTEPQDLEYCRGDEDHGRRELLSAYSTQPDLAGISNAFFTCSELLRTLRTLLFHSVMYVFCALTSFVQKPFYHFNFLDSYRDLVFTCCGGEQFSCLIFYTVKQHFLNHLSLSPNGRTFPVSGPVDTSLQIDTFHSTIFRETETSQFSSGRAPRNLYARNSNICGSLDGLFV